MGLPLQVLHKIMRLEKCFDKCRKLQSVISVFQQYFFLFLLPLSTALYSHKMIMYQVEQNLCSHYHECLSFNCLVLLKTQMPLQVHKTQGVFEKDHARVSKHFVDNSPEFTCCEPSVNLQQHTKTSWKRHVAAPW